MAGRMSWTVIYRVGGTKSFEWKRTVDYAALSDAEESFNSIRRGGRDAYIVRTDILNELGLPTTYDGIGFAYNLRRK